MKTIQLSERELSIVYSLMAPPYRAEDIRSDEFNELRNKVFYALRDAQNDEHVSQRYKLPVIGWLRSDYNSDDKRDPNAPLFMLGSNDPTETWGVKYIPLAGNSPVTTDGWTGSDEANAALIMLDRIETVDSVDDDRIEGIKRIIRGLAAAPQQEARKSNVIGSYQGADGQEHPIVSLSSPQEVK
ncbi:hypothetical protein OGX74_22155 [Citrobacter sp. CK197]|uniref:hypothetical protein n=1 Tax=Citrobacter TaxID=544 RepID=UPI001CE2D18F|nr:MULTISPECIES: hypothetical protein [Citrobacter]MDM2984098.1 hypothetical protein [Citrobacter sp. CK197]MDM2989513.1 hypothetical protein [Citrobacter sp. CK190]MDM3008703.1 hypothetical protein [Citrobacter sp. CK191]